MKKFTRTETGLFLILVLIVGVAAIISYSRKPALSPLTLAIRELAGSDAINCREVDVTDYGSFSGEMPQNRDRRPVDACAVSAFKAKTPFYAKYYTRSTDTADPRPLVFGLDGQLYTLSWEDDDSIQQTVCSNPTIVERDGHERIECGSSEAKPESEMDNEEMLK